MPYKNIKDLPASVQHNLPKDAQKIYLEAFNNAWKHYKTEETVYKIAWSAVKKKYRKDGDKWIRR